MIHRREVEFVQARAEDEHGETVVTLVFRTALGEPLVLAVSEDDARWLSASMADMAKAREWRRD